MQVLLVQQLSNNSNLQVEDVAQVGPFIQWTMDCKLTSQVNASKLPDYQIAVGLSDNSVETYDLLSQMGIMVQHSIAHLLADVQQH